MVPVRPEEVVNRFQRAARARARITGSFRTTNISPCAKAADVFADVAAVEFALAGLGRQENMRRSFVFLTSENFFSLMGVKPALGRFYNAEESRPNANIPVVGRELRLLEAHGRPRGFRRQHAVRQQSALHRDRCFAGRLQRDQRAARAGVGCRFGMYSQLGSAFSDSNSLTDLAQPKNYTLNVVARLRHGLTLETLKPRLPVLAQRLTAIQPPMPPGPRELQATAVAVQHQHDPG